MPFRISLMRITVKSFSVRPTSIGNRAISPNSVPTFSGTHSVQDCARMKKTSKSFRMLWGTKILERRWTCIMKRLWSEKRQALRAWKANLSWRNTLEINTSGGVNCRFTPEFTPIDQKVMRIYERLHKRVKPQNPCSARVCEDMRRKRCVCVP